MRKSSHDNQVSTHFPAMFFFFKTVAKYSSYILLRTTSALAHASHATEVPLREELVNFWALGLSGLLGPSASGCLLYDSYNTKKVISIQPQAYIQSLKTIKNLQVAVGRKICVGTVKFAKVAYYEGAGFYWFANAPPKMFRRMWITPTFLNNGWLRQLEWITKLKQAVV